VNHTQELKKYNFIISTADINEFYHLLVSHLNTSKETYLEGALNLDLAKEEESEFDFEDHLNLLGKSAIITSFGLENQLKRIHKFIHTRHRLYNLNLLYSSSIHGLSLKTFYTMTEDNSPTVMFIQDTNGYIFGYYSNDMWAQKASYYGTGEGFLFSLYPKFHVYLWTKKNEYFQYTTHQIIGIGSGTSQQEIALGESRKADLGYYGLRLDTDLTRGTSHICDTYLNRTLSETENFAVGAIEVWSFTTEQKPISPTTKNIKKL